MLEIASEIGSKSFISTSLLKFTTLKFLNDSLSSVLSVFLKFDEVSKSSNEFLLESCEL